MANELTSAQKLIARLKLKTDIYDNWLTSNLSLHLGELAISYHLSDDSLSTKYDFKIKVGQGNKTWSQISSYVGDIDQSKITDISVKLNDVFINREQAQQLIKDEVQRQLTDTYVLKNEFTTDNISVGNMTWLLSGGVADSL